MSDNISRLLDLGVIGINFEDRIVKGAGLYDLKRQASRVAVIRKAAEQQRVALFINARTDLFLAQGRDAAQSLGEPSTEPRRTQPQARPVSSFPACETMR